jgi:hypothetical protein
MPARRFTAKLLLAIDEGSYVKVRAGMGDHDFRGIWAVVVEGRVFVRSWSVKTQGWYHTFRKDPRGALMVGKAEVPVRAVQTRSERLKDAISWAYLDKYDSPASIRYARDLGRAKSRATTTELVPR